MLRKLKEAYFSSKPRNSIDDLVCEGKGQIRKCGGSL